MLLDPHRAFASILALVLAAAMAGCSPALDWRQLQPEGSGVVVSFPCKPDRHARTVPVAGDRLRMEMLVCAAGGLTFAVVFADVSDPARIDAALADLRATSVGNIGGVGVQERPLSVPGMTPQARAVRITMTGRLPDGAAVQEQAAFFSRGLRVYQASIIGERIGDEAVEAFFGGLSLVA